MLHLCSAERIRIALRQIVEQLHSNIGELGVKRIAQRQGVPIYGQRLPGRHIVLNDRACRALPAFSDDLFGLNACFIVLRRDDSD